MVDQRLAGVVIDDDLPTGHDHMAGPEDLGRGHGQPVEALTLQDPELAAGLVAGGSQAAVDALPGGRHRYAELGGDLPKVGAAGAQLQGLGVALGGVGPGGAVRPSHQPVRPVGVRRPGPGAGTVSACRPGRFGCR
jgi:hypothetical protein